MEEHGPGHFPKIPVEALCFTVLLGCIWHRMYDLHAKGCGIGDEGLRLVFLSIITVEEFRCTAKMFVYFGKEVCQNFRDYVKIGHGKCKQEGRIMIANRQDVTVPSNVWV